MEKKEVINKITNHSSDLMDKHFPKGECMERGKALVFNAEMIVYVSDLLEQELDKARREGEIEVLTEIFQTCYQEDSKTRELVEEKLSKLKDKK